jgi:hypothetical protein
MLEQRRMSLSIWFANGIVVIHLMIVGIIVYGGIGIFTGRYAKHDRRDYFAWAFVLCALGQLASHIVTGGCIFTAWEKSMRLSVNPKYDYSATFIQEYLPFIPEGLIQSIPYITLIALVVAVIQMRNATKR